MSENKPKKAGRKPIVLDLDKVEQLAARGLGPTQIARALGISWDTLDRNRKRNAEFEETLKRGRAKGLAQVTNSLFKSATESGNVTAQIFYLKNQDPNTWSDRNEVNHNLNLKEIINVAKTRVIEGKVEYNQIGKERVLTKDTLSKD
ncbi:MAG: helix-turn-helix domain-containing protein [Bacteroidetes bacterium]|nr:helix-turn-helix domain-containing protein [Bacteroidota bacterium]